MTYERDGLVHTIPAFAGNVVDTVGAGDAFLSITAPLVAAGAPAHQVGFVGNVVGALKVEHHIGVAHHEAHGAPLGTTLALEEEQLHLPQPDAGNIHLVYLDFEFHAAQVNEPGIITGWPMLL